MIWITDGSVVEVKAEMKAMKKALQLKLKECKTQLKGTTGLDRTLRKREVARLERQIELYAVSRFIPVRLGSIVINYKLLTELDKKMKDIRFSLEVKDEKLVLQYEGRTGKGLFQLYDMAKYYGDLEHIPAAILYEYE